jgi:transposase InsO family protein
VPQTLWLADTLHGPEVLGPRRTKRKSYLIALMDDASRAIMAARFTTSDDVAGLIPILREAILARGCPSRLLCDNGPNYRSRVLRTACAHLGIHLVYASPYRPTSKARLERFFLTVRLGFLPTLPPTPPLELANESWAKFLASYHARPHAGLSAVVGRPTTPLSYYLTHLPADVKHVSEISLAKERVVARFNPADPSRVSVRPLAQPTAPFVPAFPIQ